MDADWYANKVAMFLNEHNLMSLMSVQLPGHNESRRLNIWL